MAKQHWLTFTLILQAIFLGAVLITSSMSKSLFFGLFWLVSIGSLIALIDIKVWSQAEWISFGGLAAAIIAGVLFSLRKVQDPVGLGTSIIGLLIVCAIVVSMPRPKRRIIRKRKAPTYVGVDDAEKYHKNSCRTLKNTETEDLIHFASEEEAKRSGREACRICLD